MLFLPILFQYSIGVMPFPGRFAVRFFLVKLSSRFNFSDGSLPECSHSSCSPSSHDGLRALCYLKATILPTGHGDNRIDGEIHLMLNATELAAPYAGADKHLGYPGLETILKMRPDFLWGQGTMFTTIHPKSHAQKRSEK